MLLEKLGDKLIHNGIEFEVGMSISTNDEADEYRGLSGVILEIRTDDDREGDYDDDAPIIICELEVPEDQETIERCEKEFTELYQLPKTINDIIFDYVALRFDEINVN